VEIRKAGKCGRNLEREKGGFGMPFSLSPFPDL
jgi:hypothetical protein